VKAILGLLLSLTASAAVWPARVSESDVPALLRATERIREMDEAALLRMVPVQSGLFYVGCPNCQSGHQERQLTWSPERPDELVCRYCRHRYPSEKYPMSKTLEVRNPRGELHRYPYWEDAKGYRYFFAAHRDDEMREYLAGQTRSLAYLYAATRKVEYARRAALLLDRFAQVFPGWCYHYDYPFRQKEIFEGAVPPAKFLPGMRTARWTWWAYNDMPGPLLDAYDQIRDTGVLSPERKTRIERDLFRNVAEQLLANPEAYSNMSPRLWGSLFRVGRILEEPRYVEAPAARIARMLREHFFYDGSWAEGAPSYARQTVGSLRQALALGGDHADPPELRDAERALALLRLPNGRHVPVHDTWSTDQNDPLERSAPFLLPALGHAALAGGEGARQWQAHLTWSGGYGHEHADALSLLLWTRGREALSDLGYTHTRYRAWTLASVAHNTVVIDERNQESRATDGALRYFDASHPRVQVVSADGDRAYPGLAKRFRRTLVAVDGQYLIDWFEVEGGKVHDYFLHGDADRAGTVVLPGPGTPVPPPAGWTPTLNEGDMARLRTPGYAYGFLRDQRELRVGSTAPVAIAMPEGVRVRFLAAAGDRLYAGTNPSIRGAGEDDAQLEKFQRGFFRVRREGGSSTFIAVIEIQPGVRAVERTAKGVRVQLAGRTDEVEIGDEGVRVPSLGYALAAAKSATLETIGGDTVTASGTTQPPAGAWVRLITADGWVYPVSQGKVAGIDWDAGSRKLTLTRFPLRSHTGPVQIDWR
jgi:hypothetical protein